MIRAKFRSSGQLNKKPGVPVLHMGLGETVLQETSARAPLGIGDDPTQEHSSMSRKRPAPGASPVLNQQQQPFIRNAETPSLSDEQLLNWPLSTTETPPVRPSSGDATDLKYSSYDSDPGGYAPTITRELQHQDSGESSSQLVLREAAQYLSARTQHLAQPSDDKRSSSSIDPSVQHSGQVGSPDDTNLDQKAAHARKEAQQRRKQLSPFVQKLSR